ncbi:hypothetical protein CEN46_14750 [Fischerella thermalis CCMEE 5318]|uniref:Uncharacterized protein n=1 Tax=Fischerella thermalis CCMEE 5318 TaxID=2019666 RepID=A0A2N6LDR6_9CYAN|nr:hypothetical protein CEN46_14750 [Fischerella thermalis CCMEE 5318]
MRFWVLEIWSRLRTTTPERCEIQFCIQHITFFFDNKCDLNFFNYWEEIKAEVLQKPGSERVRENLNSQK